MKMISMQKSMLLFVKIGIFSALFAARIDKETFASRVLHRKTSYIVLMPEHSTSQKRYPVVYLLHCAGCHAGLYLDKDYGAQPQKLIDSVDFIIAIPDDGSGRGNFPQSWWLDSPVKKHMDLSRFLVEEFKPRIDSLYPTLPGRKNTGIAGHSMGGFGALHNMIEHPGVFGAAYSIKGAVDIMPFPDNWSLPEILGRQSANRENWTQVNVLENACRLKGRDISLRFYSGPNDWFADANRRLHHTLDSCSVPHTYYETGEEHTGFPFSRMRQVMFYFDSVFAGTR
ncbi:MAG: hypothetical protein GF350_02925 [Chitinivibrionales bacterium]|nr:hypothetical protein [Chitinivibrionales bacterium]